MSGRTWTSSSAWQSRVHGRHTDIKISDHHLESQWPTITGYFQSLSGDFRAHCGLSFWATWLSSQLKQQVVLLLTTYLPLPKVEHTSRYPPEVSHLVTKPCKDLQKAHYPNPQEDAKSETPKSGLKYSYGVGHGILRWIYYFLDISISSYMDPILILGLIVRALSWI